MEIIEDKYTPVEVTCKSCGSKLKISPDDVRYVFAHGYYLDWCPCCGKTIDKDFTIPKHWHGRIPGEEDDC